MIGPRGLLAVFPSTLSFYERTGMDDERLTMTHVAINMMEKEAVSANMSLCCIDQTMLTRRDEWMLG